MTDNISILGTNKIKDMGIPIGNGTDDDCSKTNNSGEANREIAKLLLSLHASGTSAPPSSDIAAFGGDNQKAEDLSVRVTNNGNNKTYQQSMQNEMALDLTSSSNSKPARSLSMTSSDSPYSAPLPASISKIVKSATSGAANTIIDLTGGGSMASITKAGNARYGSSNKASTGNSSLATVTVKPTSKLQQVPQSLQINQPPATTTSGKESQAAAAAAAAAAYPLYPQLASMANQLSPSVLSNLDKALSSNANYLLQNLLLGKIGQMQQNATGSATTNSVTASSSIASSANSTTLSLPASSLPTQPIPAQALALPTVPVSIKPPASVLKGATTNTIGLSSPNNLLNTQLSAAKGSNNLIQPTLASSTTSTNLAAASNNIIAQISSTTSPNGSSNANPLQLVEGNTATNIPLLCGQIVAQLNGLLFLVHGLNNSTIELNLQQQLIAIYTRLQEVVAMVEQAKNQQPENGSKKNEVIISTPKQGKHGGNANVTTINTTSNINNEMIQKELEKIKDSKLKEEEKIAKHIQEYQRQLLQQQNINSCLKTGTTITPIPATSLPSTSAVTLSGATNLSALTAGDSSVAAAAYQAMTAAVSNSLASLLKPQGGLSESANEIITDQLHQEADSNSLLLTQQERDRKGRRGRPPKTAGDLAQIYSSPEPKRSRSSSINTSDGVTVTLAPAVSLPTSISQNALSLTVPSGIVADLSISRPTTNGRDLTPQMNLNGLGVAANIVNGGSSGANLSPTSNGTSNIMITSNGTITPGTGGAGKGGKGIRNRVFCGECPGCLQNDDCGKCRYCKDKTKFGGQNRLRQKCLHRRCQMDTHRKRNSTNNNNSNNNSGPTNGSLPSSVSAIVAAASAAAGGGTAVNNATSSSPTQAATTGLYSGVDLARLAAQASQQHQLNLSAAAVAAAAQQVSLEQQQNVEKEASAMLKNEVSITTANSANKDKNEKEAPLVIGTTLNVPKVKTSSAILLDDQVAGKDPEDLNLSSMVRRSTRRSQRSSAVVADLKIAELQGQQRPALRSSSSGSINGSATANSVSSASDDEGLDDVSRNGPGSNASISSTNSGSKSKSRIDKWKAKHEAMLKMAENNKNPEHDDEEDHIDGEGKEIGKVEDEDEDDDILVSKPSTPVDERNEPNDSKANTSKKRSNGDEDDLKAPASKKARLRNTRSSSSLSNKEEDNTDDDNDELDESEVEIPNIEPNGVCIDLGNGDDDEPSSGGKKNAGGSGKLNMVTSTRSTRHTTMQQALSV